MDPSVGGWGRMVTNFYKSLFMTTMTSYSNVNPSSPLIICIYICFYIFIWSRPRTTMSSGFDDEDTMSIPTSGAPTISSSKTIFICFCIFICNSQFFPFYVFVFVNHETVWLKLWVLVLIPQWKCEWNASFAFDLFFLFVFVYEYSAQEKMLEIPRFSELYSLALLQTSKNYLWARLESINSILFTLAFAVNSIKSIAHARAKSDVNNNAQ